MYEDKNGPYFVLYVANSLTVPNAVCTKRTRMKNAIHIPSICFQWDNTQQYIFNKRRILQLWESHLTSKSQLYEMMGCVQLRSNTEMKYGALDVSK